jgi:hypothetical protein
MTVIRPCNLDKRLSRLQRVLLDIMRTNRSPTRGHVLAGDGHKKQR